MQTVDSSNPNLKFKSCGSESDLKRLYKFATKVSANYTDVITSEDVIKIQKIVSLKRICCNVVANRSGCKRNTEHGVNFCCTELEENEELEMGWMKLLQQLR